VMAFMNVLHGAFTTNSGAASDTLLESEVSTEAELRHHRYDTVGNSNLLPEYKCALRAFTIEMATYIQPNSSVSIWTALSESAFQMNQYNGTSFSAKKSTPASKPFETAQEIKKGSCLRTVFVHGVNGNDLFEGTFERPMKTIQVALSLTRVLRDVHGSNNALCITIRGGTYYLDTNATTTSSQVGAIALTSTDSNLVIENY
jgi:hypothetical protein